MLNYVSNIFRSMSHVHMTFIRLDVVKLTHAVLWSLISTCSVPHSPFPPELLLLLFFCKTISLIN